jgi:hypothetical protein
VFDTASNCSSIEALQVLKGLMLKKLKLADGAAKPAFVTLHSSPVNTVTLPAPARLAANIPIAAAFYSFCYPYDFDLGEGEDLSELLERHGIHYHNDPFVSWVREQNRFTQSHAAWSAARTIQRACGPISPVSRAACAPLMIL